MKVKPDCLATLCLVLIASCGGDSDSNKMANDGSDGLWLLVEHAVIERNGLSQDGIEWVKNSQLDIKSYVRLKRNSDTQITIDSCDGKEVQLTHENGKYTSDFEDDYGNYEIVFINKNEIEGVITNSSLEFKTAVNENSTFKMVRINEDFNGFIGTVDYKINHAGDIDEGESEIVCYNEYYAYQDYKKGLETNKISTAWFVGVELTNQYYIMAYDDSEGYDWIDIERPTPVPFYNNPMDINTVELLVESDSSVIDFELRKFNKVWSATIDINRM